MFTRPIVLACLACAIPETPAIVPNEEVDDVLRARLSVRDVVLTQKTRRLNEKISSFGAFGGFAQLLGVD